MDIADKNSEALLLAEEILKNIELDEVPLSRVCLKTSRLSRLIGDLNNIDVFSSWSTYCAQTEAYLEAAKQQLIAAADKPVSISSANPNQYVSAPFGNNMERHGLRQGIEKAQGGYQSYSSKVYKYVMDVYFNKKFSGTVQDIFENTRKFVDEKLISIIPESAKKLASISNNLNSDNSEDWANAGHLCRKLLQNLADVLFPSCPDGQKKISKNGKEIEVGEKNYINRLICYIESQEVGKKYKSIITSGLEYIGNQLDSVYEAANKGSHADLSKNEAERYVIYAYMLIGDILYLSDDKIEKNILDTNSKS